jgi:phosphoglucomutase
MPDRPVAVKTIVSTPMAAAVAKAHGVETVSVLTGFKFIGEQITLLEKKGEDGRFVFGFEESCGYMSGAHVRDKDAVNACMLLSELAAECKSEGETVIDRMERLYGTYGFYESSLMEFVMEGESGMGRIARIMERLRACGGDIFTGRVAESADYMSSQRLRAGGGPGEAIALPKSDVLEYVLENGNSVIVRPSGTEPKLKVYIAALGGSRAEAEGEAAALMAEIRSFVNGVE